MSMRCFFLYLFRGVIVFFGAKLQWDKAVWNIVFPHMVLTPRWVAWEPRGGMGQHGGRIFDHEASCRLILAPLIQANIKEDDVLLHEMGRRHIIAFVYLFTFSFWSGSRPTSLLSFKPFHLLHSSRGSLPPDSGGRRFVARGLERGKLLVWPRTFGEHADLLGAQTVSDCTFGRTGLQRGALNNLFVLLLLADFLI